MNLTSQLKGRFGKLRESLRSDDLLKYYNSADPQDRSAMDFLYFALMMFRRYSAIMTVAVLVLSCCLFYQIQYAKLAPPIVMTIDKFNMVDDVKVIRDNDHTYRDRATGHFLRAWIMCREPYHPSTYLLQFRGCKYFAPKGPVLEALMRDFNPENKDGYFQRHGGDDATGSASVEILYMHPTPHADKKAATKMMSVHFMRSELDRSGKLISEHRYVAQVEYFFSTEGQKKDSIDFNPFGLQIVSYVVNLEELK